MHEDTIEVRADEGFDEGALAAYLRGKLPGAENPLAVRQFGGGAANLTYLLDFGEQEYVLRRPPLGPVAKTAPAVPAKSPATMPSSPASRPAPTSQRALSRVEKALGKATMATLINADKAWMTSLKTPAVRAPKVVLGSKEQLGGYHILSPLRALSAEAIKSLGELLTKDKSYSLIARRCANRSRLGARFQSGDVLVELSLGAPCDQLLLSWSANGKVQDWGSVVVESAAKEMRALLGRVAKPQK